MDITKFMLQNSYITNYDVITSENNKKLYVCKSFNCNKKFTRFSRNTEHHFIRHLEMNLPYTCHYCFMGFKRTSDLRRHVTNTHSL